jgi:flagellar biosynthetic protein FlhB
MTREEVLRERLEAEGNPRLKVERQRAHRELSRAADLTRVERASIVICDERRWAVALGYDADGDAAPVVTVQAMGQRSRDLIALALAHGVPLFDDAALARRLSSVPLEEEIPPELYAAVADALGSVRPPPSDAAG